MGIYDRDYFRAPPRRRSTFFWSDWTVVSKLILVNIVLFLANGLLTSDNALTWLLSIHGDTLTRPLYYWQLLTYGFAHDPNNLMHIGGNMLCLFLFGYELEHRLGSREFLRFYLAAIVFGGFLWAVSNLNTQAPCLGASGGVVALVILYAVFYPHRTLLFMFVIPMPAWLLGVLIVAWDLLGELGVRENTGRVAFMVHLGGAAFAFLYYHYRWNFLRAQQRVGTFLTGFLPKKHGKRPDLHVFRANQGEKPRKKTEEDRYNERVDEVLKKYAREGEAGLTDEERALLKNASKKYQDKHRR